MINMPQIGRETQNAHFLETYLDLRRFRWDTKSGPTVRHDDTADSRIMTSTQSANEPYLDILYRWITLGEAEKRTFLAVANELEATSELMANDMGELTARFSMLANEASEQSRRARRMAELAGVVNVDGKAVPVVDAVRMVSDSLNAATAGLSEIEVQATTMVEALDLVHHDVIGAIDCIEQIEAVNKQARFLALNAMIEAVRAQGAGITFKVVGNEVKELSNKTEAVAASVRQRIGAIKEAVERAQTKLRAMSGGRRSADVNAQARLGKVLEGVVAQNAALGDVLVGAEASAHRIGGHVNALVNPAQFQDRAAQQIQHVVAAVKVLGIATEKLQKETCRAAPSISWNGSIDSATAQKILEGQTLSGVGQRFRASLTGESSTRGEYKGGDVELF